MSDDNPIIKARLPVGGLNRNQVDAFIEGVEGEDKVVFLVAGTSDGRILIQCGELRTLLSVEVAGVVSDMILEVIGKIRTTQ
jgi:hypothetical protein